MTNILGRPVLLCLLMLCFASGCGGSDDSEADQVKAKATFAAPPAELCNRLALFQRVTSRGFEPSNETDDSSFGGAVSDSYCLLDLEDDQAAGNRGTLYVRLEVFDGSTGAEDRYAVFADEPVDLGPTDWELKESAGSPMGWWDEAHAETATRSHPTAKRYENHSHELVIRDDNLVVRIWLHEELTKRRKGPDQADALIDEIVKAVHEQVTGDTTSR